MTALALHIAAVLALAACAVGCGGPSAPPPVVAPPPDPPPPPYVRWSEHGWRIVQRADRRAQPYPLACAVRDPHAPLLVCTDAVLRDDTLPVYDPRTPQHPD